MICRWTNVGLAFLLAGVTACGKKEVTEPAVCVVSISALAFGNVGVGQTKDLTLRVENAGGGTLWITPRTCADDSLGCEPCPDFSILDDPNVLLHGRGAAITITIRFAPSSPGEHRCFVDFLEDCPLIVLDGTGVAGVPAIRDPWSQ